jgi:hypothetical protein
MEVLLVKKGSIFSRLRERWRSPSGIKVEAGQRPVPGEAGTVRATLRGEVRPQDVRSPEPRPQELSTRFAAEAAQARKLSDREEAMVALGAHFQELAGLMRGVQSRMDGQFGKLTEAAVSLSQLPALGQQQLEVLRGLSGHMERQTALGEQVAATLSVLPNLLQNVEGALARAAATDERTATTMREFQSTMERIHAAMGRMVDHSEQSANAARSLAEQREESLRTLASSLETTQRESVKELRSAADQGLAALRRTHEDQSNRLQKVVEQHAGWNKVVLVGIVIVGLGLGALLVINLVK